MTVIQPAGSGTAFPIVGIGASAGGVEALEGFFRGMPGDPGLGFVVVTHLSPHRESLLHEIVARYTTLTVEVAADGAKVGLNCVHVLPAGAILGIEQGRLRIRKPHPDRRERKPIDIFFSALAVDQGERAAGVVLSGGDGDGTLGVKAIKERGGLTLAQVADGFGPQHPDMPESAISAGFVDFAVPVGEMGPRLVEFARRPNLVDVLAGAEERATFAAAKKEICDILRNQVGHDFSGYKMKTFVRRVERRMQVTQSEAIESYISHLRRDPQEVRTLFRDLLINVTNFFRDADAFETLKQHVIPKLFEGRGADDTVRVWVPGCATGEEVFSIAILMREHMDTVTALPRVQIFATDIDEHALSVARAGRYPRALLDSVSADRQKRFFLQDGGSFVLSREVRDLCIFSPHSVLRDPPFSRIDLVSCRNLLIYFGADAQNQVIPTFHYALHPGGYLFLGMSENVSQFSELFVPVEKKHRIFRSRTEGAPAVRLPLVIPGLHSRLANGGLGAGKSGLSGAIALRQSVEAQILERFSPPHVVVNGDGEVVYYSPKTGKYIEAAPGVPTRQILSIARRGLRLDLRTVLRSAIENDRTDTRPGIAVEGDDGRVQMVTLTVEPLRGRDGDPLFLVLFEDVGPAVSREEARNRIAAADESASIKTEQELRETRERLQSVIEEYETALEELKASNEELTSLNEEMQSSNEELEASKEEQQSLNEELHTINAELQVKVEALDRANADLHNLFESTDLATVFLDNNLAIRSFTPAVSRVFNILPSDRGRRITDLASRFPLPGLAEDVATVLAEGHGLERRIDQEDGAENFLVRLAPYRETDQTVRGVVVTILDVSSLTRAEAQLRVLIAELQHRTRNLLAMVQAVAQQTLNKGGSLETYMDRLAALGRVQGLISHAADQEIDLAEIVDLELNALTDEANGQVSVAGPPVALSLERVQTFALALHELATNAVKHGALKSPGGRLDITWTVQDGGGDGRTLVLDWRESGISVPPSSAERRGYGRILIERALAFTLRAKTELLFGLEGISCRIEMPLPSLRAG